MQYPSHKEGPVVVKDKALFVTATTQPCVDLMSRPFSTWSFLFCCQNQEKHHLGSQSHRAAIEAEDSDVPRTTAPSAPCGASPSSPHSLKQSHAVWSTASQPCFTSACSCSLCSRSCTPGMQLLPKLPRCLTAFSLLIKSYRHSLSRTQ